MRPAFRYSIVLLGGCLLFLPFLGQVHLFDWDEINFAECAREMISSGDYLRAQIAFQPFYEKPPLFIWLQVCSMKALGINEYAARLPNAIAGIATLLLLYHIGRKRAGERAGVWWTLLYACTWLPHFYFKSAIIDPIFNLLIFLAIVQMHAMARGERPVLRATLAGALLGLAVLTKGPVAILVAGLCFAVFFIWTKGRTGIRWTALVLLGFAALGMVAMWVVPEVLLHGWDFPREFLVYQVGLFSKNIADHQEPWYYHPLVLLIGCFPVSVFLFQWKKKRGGMIENDGGLSSWIWILFWVVLILFSIVKTKIVHYSSLCYFPMTYLAAREIVRILDGAPVKKITQALFIVIGSALAMVIASLPVIGLNAKALASKIADQNTAAALLLPVPWSFVECFWGLLFLSAVIITGIFLRKKPRLYLVPFFLLQLVTLQVTILHFTPKIEAYSQRAAIEFIEGRAGQDIYMHTLGYKSYAHYFYGRVGPDKYPQADEERNLLYGPLNKDAYFISKISSSEDFENIPGLQKLYGKGGFVFYRRARMAPHPRVLSQPDE